MDQEMSMEQYRDSYKAWRKEGGNESDWLRAQVERVHGWDAGKASGFSWGMLREMVRTSHPRLSGFINDYVSSGRNVLGKSL